MLAEKRGRSLQLVCTRREKGERDRESKENEGSREGQVDNADGNLAAMFNRSSSFKKQSLCARVMPNHRRQERDNEAVPSEAHHIHELAGMSE